jgi:hypothetical protein
MNGGTEIKSIADVKNALTEFNKHNEEQRVITRMNEPLKKQCQEWLAKISAAEVKDEKVSEIIKNLKVYLSDGTGLKELKTEVEEYLIFMTKKKMEELDAYKY